MTAAFGTFINNSSKPVKIVAAYTSSKLSKFSQLHEVVMKDGAMKMQEKAGGFVIPAKGKLQLRPGGNHTMLMGLVDDVVPGSITKITYVTSTGERFTKSFLGKIYAGGSESYDATPANTSAVTFSGSGTGQASGITVTNPLFRVPDMMSPYDFVKKTYTTGGFMVIENKGSSTATLIGGTADFGGKVITIQETVGTNQWTDMPTGLSIDAGSSIKMRMKGYHVTIKGVPADVAGKKVNVNLMFSDGSKLATKFQFVVIPSTDATYGFAK
jgi:copper(I)-binding protein